MVLHDFIGKVVLQLGPLRAVRGPSGPITCPSEHFRRLRAGQKKNPSLSSVLWATYDVTIGSMTAPRTYSRTYVSYVVEIGGRRHADMSAFFAEPVETSRLMPRCSAPHPSRTITRYVQYISESIPDNPCSS